MTKYVKVVQHNIGINNTELSLHVLHINWQYNKQTHKKSDSSYFCNGSCFSSMMKRGYTYFLITCFYNYNVYVTLHFVYCSCIN